MKAVLMDVAGKKKESISLPKSFSSPIRLDILSKVFEAQRLAYSQPYGAKEGAGAQYSASGIIKRKRHDWKTSYGKGISRIPRKIMSRSGASFNWIGATVSNTRGGRRPHAPRSIKNPFKKINKKELSVAFQSALAGTVSPSFIAQRYGTAIVSGIVFDPAVLTLKTKEFLQVLRAVFGENYSSLLQRRRIRSGIGKMRGRKYKRNAGLLFVIGNEETMKRSGIDVVRVSDLRISDISLNGEPGRVTCYTPAALKHIEERFG